MEMDSLTLPLSNLRTLCFTLTLATTIFAVTKAVASRLQRLNDGKRVADVPVVGIRNEWLAWPRAVFRSILGSRATAFEGYSKYSVFNLPYLMPTMDRGPMVLIPPRHAKDVYGLPETRLDVWDTINDSIQTRYTIQDHHIIDKALHRDVLKNQISRNLAILTEPLARELDHGLINWWGTDRLQWKTVPAFESSLNIVAGAANVAFLGPSLCRNQQFLRRLKRHATTVFSGGIIINVTPWPFRQIVGCIFRVTCRYNCNKVLDLCLPLVQERLEKTIRWNNGLEYDWTPPSDGLQWMIEEAVSKNDPVELNAQRLGERLLFLNDVSMHTSAFTMQALLQNLAASDPKDRYMDTLRDECRRVLEEAGGEWTQKAVQKLVLLDSTIRESMRMSPFSIFGLPRTVIDPKGVSFGTTGSEHFLPVGTIVALPVEHAHYDEQAYQDAHTFRPFRFVHEEEDGSITVKKTSVTLDEHFLAFGHGKHGCPGRFFVTHELKLLMANILLNYEIEPLPSKKELFHVMWLKLPLNGLKLRVRRRTPPSFSTGS